MNRGGWCQEGHRSATAGQKDPRAPAAGLRMATASRAVVDETQGRPMPGMVVPLPALLERRSEALRASVRGKFFHVGQEKVLLRGVTYGSFRPGEDGSAFPAPEIDLAPDETRSRALLKSQDRAGRFTDGPIDARTFEQASSELMIRLSAAGAGGDGRPSRPSSSSVARAPLDPPRAAPSPPTQDDGFGAALGDAGDEHGRRPRATGTFLSVGPDKPLVCGMTYGALAPNPEGEPYPDPRTVDADFARMAAAGINAITTHTTPGWLLDLASAQGLFVMAGIAWAQHVAFVDRRARRK